MRPTLALAAAVALMLPLAANAAGGRQFDKLDANRDGRVTQQEFMAATGQHLMTGSGKAAQRFQKLSPERQAAVLQRRFDKLDEGHKGYLTRDDLAAARKAHRQHKAGN